jgi:lysophospholipase L1-like esterase
MRQVSVGRQRARAALRDGLSAACFVLALWSASCQRSSPDAPTSPTPPETNQISWGVVAASDGIGIGASVPCLPFDPDCPSGTGYVYVLKRRLQADGRTVTLNNRALPGAVLSDAMLNLAREIGRTDIPGTFLDQIAPFVPSSSTAITIFAGGNDTNVIAQSIRAGRAGSDVRGYIDGHVRQWGTDLEELVRRLRNRAPSARIVAINLPNLGAAPYLAGNTTQERSIVQAIAVGLSDRVNALAPQNVLVVDLLCDSRVYEPASFSGDGFHPSDRGYSVMAELTYPALATGASSPPSSSCGSRRLLPVF